MKITTISGWGQETDSIDELASRLGGEVTNIPYVSYRGVDELYAKVKEAGEPDILMGWSLGAQLSSRLVEDKIVSPKLLVLLAPPYQYQKGGEVKEGMPGWRVGAFAQLYKRFPNKAGKDFMKVVAQGDENTEAIVSTMDEDPAHREDWLKWLQVLRDFSCKDMNFDDFPNTVIFHGDNDAITKPEQGKRFADAIDGSRLEIVPKCGHAPHLHDGSFLEKVIREEMERASIER